MKSLSESSAIVTGASSGIGRATALALARKGARLALTARSAERLEDVVSEAKQIGAHDCFAQSIDIRDETQVGAFVSDAINRHSGVDILINSAGLSLNGEVDGYPLENWKTVLETNLTGTFLTCRAVLPSMKTRGGGQIINIASGAGHNGIREMAAYCASKFGVIGFTESLALEVRNHDIRVSTLSPGSVSTGFSATARGMKNVTSQETYAMTAGEVAEVIVAMLSQPSQAWMSEVILRPLNLELRRRSD